MMHTLFLLALPVLSQEPLPEALQRERLLLPPTESTLGQPADATALVGQALALAPSAGLLVGAPAWSATSPRAGTVLVRTAVDSLEPWTPADPEAGAHFGQSLAVGTGWVAVSAPLASPSGLHAGRVEVFADATRAPQHLARILPSSPSLLAGFGTALAADGDLLVVGAPRQAGPAGEFQAGAVELHRRSPSGTFAFEGSLPVAAQTGAQLGSALAVAGDLLFVGAPGAGSRGEVYIFSLASDPPALLAQLAPASGPASARFGSALCKSGTLLAVGAPGQEGGYQAGRVHLFDLSGPTPLAHSVVTCPAPDARSFGASLAASEGSLLAAAPLGTPTVCLIDGAFSCRVLRQGEQGSGLGTGLLAAQGTLILSEPGLEGASAELRACGGRIHLTRTLLARESQPIGAAWVEFRLWSDGETALLMKGLTPDKEHELELLAEDWSRQILLPSDATGTLLASQLLPHASPASGSWRVRGPGVFFEIPWPRRP